jgi:hypothetical protein
VPRKAHSSIRDAELVEDRRSSNTTLNLFFSYVPDVESLAQVAFRVERNDLEHAAVYVEEYHPTLRVDLPNDALLHGLPNPILRDTIEEI